MTIEHPLDLTVPELAAPADTRAARSWSGAGVHVRSIRGHVPALAALLASVAVYAVAFALIPGTGDEDAALHAIYTRFPSDPSRLLSVWSRPLFAIPYLLPAHFGYDAMRAFTVLICAATAWLTYLLVRRIGLRHAWLAIPFVMFQPCLFVVGTDTMTEPIFALTLAAGLLAFADDHILLAAGIWSLLPLARPEGPFILVLAAAVWLPSAFHSRRHLFAILLLGLGTVVWELLCCAITRDPLYLIHTFPWTVGTSPVHGTLLHYVRRWPIIIGWGLLPLWLIGLWPSCRQRVLRLCVLMIVLIFSVHTLLFAFGKMGSWGFDRYFATLAPVEALIATAGVAALGRLVPHVLAPVALLLAFQSWQAFTTLVFQPMNYMPAATRDGVAEGKRLADLRTQPFVSADYFGYVFLDDDWGSHQLPVASHDVTAAAITKLPVGTIVLWDDMIGDWWFHLSVQDFTARGYRMLWTRETMLGSPFAIALERVNAFRYGRLYPWIAGGVSRPLRQALLVRE